MLKIFKAIWWKLLSIPVLVYVMIFGLLMPIGPGITDLNKTSIITGERNEILVKTYNTHLQETSNSLQLWLKNGDTFFCGDILDVGSNQISVSFSVPSLDLEKQFFDLIINNDIDGTFELRDAFVVAKEQSDLANRQKDCKVEVKSNQAAFFKFPNREILKESIRNLFFHVSMWFAMAFLLLFSAVCSIVFLNSQKTFYDQMAHNAVLVAMLLGAMGIITGMIWAKFTWGAFWPNDPKLNGVLVGMLVYFAYLILRGSVKDENKKGRLAAVYNIFAFIMYVIFIYVYPDFSSSLHPGMGANPAFSEYDLDNNLRIVFYPAVIGWSILAFWLFSLLLRYTLIHNKMQSFN